MSLDAAREYLASPHLEPELKADLEPLLKAAEAGDSEALIELNDRFSEPLTFGTGGLRGIMASGLRRMNAPNIRRATLAVAAVASKRAPEQMIAIVGSDSRLNSDVFSRETARVLAAAGYTVYLGDRPLPTPFLCFAMRHLKAGCGIIITASHNPKAYNGFKAYDNIGGQVVTPWDAEIEAAVNDIPVVPPKPTSDVDSRILPIPAEVEEAYLQLGLGYLQKPAEFAAAKILYTPFHGTGGAFVPRFFERAGIPLSVCTSQIQPDGNFPTAPRPNPEEIAAYKATIEEADQIGAEAIMANDPDADRIGVITKNKQGVWQLMTGNDLCALTLDYMASNKAGKGAVVTTVVTSDLVVEVAKLHGLPVIWTLTGFKWIGLAMERLQQRGERYLFGAEESFGMEISDDIRDKDGCTAALLVAEMIGHYKAKGMTLFDAVEALYAKVGTTFTSHLVNLEDPRPGGAQRFAEAMDRIRKAGLTSFAGEKVVSWEDFQAGELHKSDGTVDAILDRPELRNIALPLPKSNVLKFRLESGAYAAFRPSGTEPKLKIYVQSRTGREIIEKIEAEARVLLGL